VDIVGNEMEKLTSIIIPAYNCERWLGETIESALVQSWPRKEIIIIDDGSNDKTLSIAKKYESNLLKVVHKDNGGVASARNVGLIYAQGDYIQWLDADDILDEKKIEKQVEVIEREGDGVLATGEFGAFYFRIKKAIFKETALWNDLNPLEWLITRFSQNVWMASHAWLISRALSEKAGPWDERLRLDEDGEYFCRVVSKSKKIKFVQDAKCFYRVGNFGSLRMDRSNRALESLLLSMDLSFKHLRFLEDSERVMTACLKFLENRILDYYPDNSEILEEAKNLSKELGGVLSMPNVGWKLDTAKKVLGWRKAIILRNLARKIKTSIYSNIDEVLYKMNGKRGINH
jgi:glycosyltransferase involved in cell wall biosynthesis